MVLKTLKRLGVTLNAFLVKYCLEKLLNNNYGKISKFNDYASLWGISF
jgi:hypothetical protein